MAKSKDKLTEEQKKGLVRESMGTVSGKKALASAVLGLTADQLDKTLSRNIRNNMISMEGADWIRAFHSVFEEVIDSTITRIFTNSSKSN